MKFNKETAIELLKKHGVRDIKIKHCINVANIAKFLGVRLKEKGVEVDVEKTYFAALVHDIGDKKRDNDWDKDKHCEYSVEILENELFHEITKIISKHNVKAFASEDSKPKTWEEKILNYADKREKNGIISIEERKKRFLECFPDKKETIIKSFLEIEKIEKEIFEIIGIIPNDLIKHVEIE